MFSEHVMRGGGATDVVVVVASTPAAVGKLHVLPTPESGIPSRWIPADKAEEIYDLFPSGMG